MRKLRALDLFCGAGGASRGLADAGFEVEGFDIKPQPNYAGHEFKQCDVLASMKEWHWFDFIWASPPCQAYITGGLVRDREKRPRLIEPVREELLAWGGPFVIENVPKAPIRRDLMLCGSHFDLPLRRHRHFELHGFSAPQPECNHKRPIVGVYGRLHGKAGAWPGMLPSTLETWSEAMGIDWMTARELTQAIPPAYAEHIGRAAIKEIENDQRT